MRGGALAKGITRKQSQPARVDIEVGWARGISLAKRPMRERYDTVVIGGGQAGLAMSYHLREHGREHIILERNRVAERWRSERWNSLYFQFPNWSLKLPGFEYRGDDPQGFAHHPQITKFIEDYALFIDAPVRCGVEVTAVSQARRFRPISHRHK